MRYGAFAISEHSFYVRKATNIFEPKATRVLRALLIDLQRNWTIRGLAKETGISVAYTHAVISTLIDIGYAARTEVYKIKVVNPTLLLRKWGAYHQYDKANTFLEYYTFEHEIDRFIDKLTTITTIPYALTGLAGAFLVAPHVRPVDVHVYIHKEDAEALAKILRLQLIPKGGNVKFVIPYDEGVFYDQQRVNVQVSDQAASGVTVVSNVQLFVDLYNSPARGLEAAEDLYKQMVDKWEKALIGE